MLSFSEFHTKPKNPETTTESESITEAAQGKFRRFLKRLAREFMKGKNDKAFRATLKPRTKL